MGSLEFLKVDVQARAILADRDQVVQEKQGGSAEGFSRCSRMKTLVSTAALPSELPSGKIDFRQCLLVMSYRFGQWKRRFVLEQEQHSIVLQTSDFEKRDELTMPVAVVVLMSCELGNLAARSHWSAVQMISIANSSLEDSDCLTSSSWVLSEL